MPFIVNRYQLTVDPDGKFPVIIGDYSIDDTTTSINIIGKGVTNYSEPVAEDFVYLLENFAGPLQPSNKITGQTWYDSGNLVLKVNLGTTWKALGTSVTNNIQPSSPSIGDLWYNSATNTLSYWNGSMWIPLFVQGTAAQAEFNNGNNYLAMEVNGQDVAIFSATTFTPSPAIPGFPEVFAGLTFNDTGFNGISSGTLLPLIDDTFDIGSNPSYPNVPAPHTALRWRNGYFGGNLEVDGNAVFNGTATFNGPVIASGGYQNIIPEANDTYNLGSPSFEWANLYVGVINASGDILPSVTDTYVVGNPAFQWENGNFANLVIGDLTAQSPNSTVTGSWILNAGATWDATYADIAEKYEADTFDLTVGTLVAIAGSKDITRTQEDCSMEVFGVVSGNAAFRMNAELGHGPEFPFIAHNGTIPVLVTGKIRKGQRLVSSELAGHARAITNTELLSLGIKAAFVVIGRALSDKDTDGPGLLERATVNIVA